MSKSVEIPKPILKHIEENFKAEQSVMGWLSTANKTKNDPESLKELCEAMYRASNYKLKAREVVEAFEQGKEQLIYQNAKTYNFRFKTFRNFRTFLEENKILEPYVKK